MKHIKILILASVILITGMYGWYLFASAVNKSADQAATVIIQDTLSSNNAYEIRTLREIQKLISEGKANDASAMRYRAM
jgi:predicted negative regulator of RcsB-dependent stress response